MSTDDGLDCCRGEGYMHPRGLHSPSCAVYRANCDWLERYYAVREVAGTPAAEPAPDRAAADRVRAWLDARPNYGREDGSEPPIVASLPAVEGRGHLHLYAADLRALAGAGAPEPGDAVDVEPLRQLARQWSFDARNMDDRAVAVGLYRAARDLIDHLAVVPRAGAPTEPADRRVEFGVRFSDGVVRLYGLTTAEEAERYAAEKATAVPVTRTHYSTEWVALSDVIGAPAKEGDRG